ncbi:MAG: hypothetical protein KBH15_00335 [Candidatus Atribacteria bacterium]|nr:hypothetical protein [Candidatus Atribacteria bacterium]
MKKEVKRIKWWVVILIVGFSLLFWGGKGWRWFSRPHTWSDVAILTREIEEKGQKLNQILQETLQSIMDKEAPVGH